MKSDYNGWTNRSTWYINLMYQEIFSNMVEEQTFDDVEHLANAFESLVDELEFECLDQLKSNQCGLAQQLVGEFLQAVNWEEIAEHYVKDFDLFKEVGDSEEDIQGLRELLAEAKEDHPTWSFDNTTLKLI